MFIIHFALQVFLNNFSFQSALIILFSTTMIQVTSTPGSIINKRVAEMI